MTESPDTGGVTARAMSVVALVVVVVAAAGFLAGTRQAPELAGYSSVDESPDHGSIPRASPQAEMELARYRDRIAQQAAAFAAMGERPPTVERTPASAEEWQQALAARREQRAYDGAPPTVPHPIDTHGAPACLVCHEDGADIDGRVAPAMSHEPYQSCLQCHAPQGGFPFETQSPLTVSNVNTFVGNDAPAHGPRAWPAAPPTLPHRSFMRENCSSCHGVWASGLRTSHPQRQSCTQCHGPSAELDQQPHEQLPMQGL